MLADISRTTRSRKGAVYGSTGNKATDAGYKEAPYVPQKQRAMTGNQSIANSGGSVSSVGSKLINNGENSWHSQAQVKEEAFTPDSYCPTSTQAASAAANHDSKLCTPVRRFPGPRFDPYRKPVDAVAGKLHRKKLAELQAYQRQIAKLMAKANEILDELMTESFEDC
ncbi:hypothetical protein K440DRAFT_643394 [Wilcoxina mikolae CBS 423.85]|nr:hypothetical protein K440DRAFT_643394 [Wilcoxina mikolae CBS 423.85]